MRLLLGVHRLQLFVHGLHLFPGGGQLLIGGLQFLIGGLQFLVGGFELFLRGLHLLAGGLKFFADLPELLLQFANPGIAGRRFSCAALRFLFQRRRHVGKDDHHHPLQRLRLFDLLDSDINGLLAAVRSNL